MRRFFLLVSFIWIYQHGSANTLSSLDPVKPITGKDRIIIEIHRESERLGDTVNLSFLPLEVPTLYKWESVKAKQTKNGVKWEIGTSTPLFVNIAALLDEFKLTRDWLSEPGDSIVIIVKNKELIFEGEGSEKFKLQYEIDKSVNEVKRPTNDRSYLTRSIQDYLDYNNYLNNQLKVILPLIDANKDKITSFASTFIKINNISKVEGLKCFKFAALIGQPAVTSQNLCNLFDSTLFYEPEKWMRASQMGTGISGFIRLKVYRNFAFSFDNDSLKNEVYRKFLYYEEGNRVFKGRQREQFLVKLMAYDVIKDIGFTPETEALLAKYYADTSFTAYKDLVKAFEMKERKRGLDKGYPAPDLELYGKNGKRFKIGDFKGKIVLMNFETSNFKEKNETGSFLRKMRKSFKNDTSVVFINVTDSLNGKGDLLSRDRNLSQGIRSLTLGNNYSNILRKYGISSFPPFLLIDTNGKIAENLTLDPVTDEGRELTKVIQAQLVLQQDGPYVLKKNNSTYVYTFNGAAVSKKEFKSNKLSKITVQTDEYGKTFNVKLKRSLQIEPSEFEQPQKLLALSDIEGNFDALRKMLLENQVIDKNYNWIFDKGHLVFVGDMFDRGSQVTECLWLIYSLEEKAKKAGGYVHFILGNHEIMNLSGDHYYAREKYKENARRLGISYMELYNENSELGKWLRTKNIMERVGELLFVHGGISKEVNDLRLSIGQINDIVRPFYDKDSIAKKLNYEALSVLFNSNKNLSPFWYRSYYQNEDVKYMTDGDTLYKTPGKVVGSTLNKFHVAHIVTGHTIVRKPGEVGASIVSAHYDNRVINLDTYHAYNKSEALLIVGDEFYRVNAAGKQVLLFRRGERKQNASNSLSYIKGPFK